MDSMTNLPVKAMVELIKKTLKDKTELEKGQIMAMSTALVQHIMQHGHLKGQITILDLIAATTVGFEGGLIMGQAGITLKDNNPNAQVSITEDAWGNKEITIQ